MDNYVGKRLDGRYEIQEIIDVGGMSVVYKAYDNIDDRTVAVKILKEEFWNNEEFKRRFRNESKAIALLSHENIVKLYDVNFSGSLQYIVMEYIDGITLKDYIDKIGAINWNDALYFMTQILKAVQHAHDKGIVHRDIRPQNIILLSNRSLKVTHFGIERYSETNSPTRYSNQYVSPEIVLGNFENEKSDIYAAGVVLYEMLVGALPLQNEPIDTVITSIRSNIKRLKKANQEIPTGLEQICVRATQKDPIDRYENAYEMICDIESVVEDPNVIFKYPLSLREYLLRLPKGYLSYKRTLGLFLPFLDSLIETNQNKNIDLCPDNIYYLCIKNKLVFDKEVAQEINIGYSAIETHKRKIRNETAIVYSIAACMYRTLVGCNPPSAVDRELDDKLLIPNEIADNIPSCVIRALAGALKVHPNDRTKTILEFRQELSVEEKNAENTCDDSLESFMDNSEIFDQSPKKSVPFKGFKKNSLFKFFKKIPTKKTNPTRSQYEANEKTFEATKKTHPYSGKKSYVFISYAHKDKKEIYPIIEKLINDGYRVWYDEGIDPGTEWDENIAKHIEECGYFISFISENYLKSSNCKDELNFARDLDKDRFLVYLQNINLPSGMNMRLSRLQNIHKYAYDSFDEFYKKLLTAKGIEKFK